MTPSATALLDQIQAATNHATASLHVLADRINGTAGEATPGAIGQQLIQRLDAGLRGHHIGFCHHLTATAPQPAYWAPWAPGIVRCPPCFHRAGRRVSKTAENRKCDQCRRRAVTMHFAVLQLPAVVIALPGRAVAVPPIQVNYSLCSTCKQLDRYEIVKATA